MATRQLIAMVWAFVVVGGCTNPTPDAPTSRSPTDTEPAVAVVPLPDRPLRLGRPPHLTVAATREEYEPLVQYLAESIDHPIELVVPDHYSDVPRALAAGELDMALLTPLTYVRAKSELEGLRLIASLLGEGSSRYRGYVVASASSGIETLDGLRGKSFAFVDQDSTSGYLFPMALLMAHGIVPERDFSTVAFAGSHVQVVRGILDGTYAGGAISSTTYNHMRDEVLSARLTILAKTAWIPLDAFVTHPSLPQPVSEKLKQTLLQLNVRTPEGRAVLRGKTITNGFIKGDDTAYDPVREVAKMVDAKEAGILPSRGPEARP